MGDQSPKVPGAAPEWLLLQVQGSQGLQGAQGEQGERGRETVRGYYNAQETYQSGDIVFFRSVSDTEEVPYQFVCVQGECQPGEPGTENTSWVILRGTDGVANDLLFGLLILAASVV